MGIWYYRACKKYDIYGGKKIPFYCVVEYCPKVLLSRTGKKRKNLWSTEPEAPMGANKQELIECLEAMLRDIKYHRTLVEKKPYKEAE